jgi:hypothetical protein
MSAVTALSHDDAPSVGAPLAATSHPTKHDTLVPLIDVRHLTYDSSCEWVVSRVTKKTAWCQGNPSMSKSISGSDDGC